MLRNMTILDNLLRCSDRELVDIMKYIRIDGEPVVSVVQLRHVLRAEQKRLDDEARRGSGHHEG